MLSMKLFGGAVNQGAVRLLPELALAAAGGHVQPGEVSQQEEGADTEEGSLSKEGEMERSGMSRIGAPTAAAAGHYVRSGLDDSSAERHRGPARRAGVR